MEWKSHPSCTPGIAPGSLRITRVTVLKPRSLKLIPSAIGCETAHEGKEELIIIDDGTRHIADFALMALQMLELMDTRVVDPI
ncbi:hypothetical protein EDB19DRAFT_1905283 [Suillus lakei]|nr:hypothetical protein EDB19DRAFT_1905283 [Suillus lakei]